MPSPRELRVFFVQSAELPVNRPWTNSIVLCLNTLWRTGDGLMVQCSAFAEFAEHMRQRQLQPGRLYVLRNIHVKPAIPAQITALPFILRYQFGSGIDGDGFQVPFF
jgi:hypothetical protein